MSKKITFSILFNSCIDWLSGWSDADLEDRQTLREVLEQYDFAYDFREALMLLMGEWEVMLRLQYNRIESAVSKIDVDPEELREEEEDEREDETTE